MFALVIIVNVFVLHLSLFFQLVNLLSVTHPSGVRHPDITHHLKLMGGDSIWPKDHLMNG